MINPDFIQTFVVLARTRHFTQTAKLLHMTQPGVSQHLKRLEEYFGVPLLDRRKTDLVLTEAGQRLASYGESLERDHLKLLECLKQDLPHEGHVRFSATGSPGLLLFDVLMECGVRHPKLRLDLVVSPSGEMDRRILADEVDVTYGAIPSQDERVHSVPCFEEELCVSVPEASRPKTYRDYCEMGVVMHPELPRLLEKVFAPNFKEFGGLQDFRIWGSINQANRIIDPVNAGLGFTILNRIATSYHSRGKKVRQVHFKRAEIFDQIYRAQRKRRKLPARVLQVEEQFMKALKKYKL